jgi:outer membrane protein OmpA-like peptidoglycan-associated protein
VRKYIVEQLHVPEGQINVTSLGETRPAAPTDTKDGRAENRRVVVQVAAVPVVLGN